MYYIILIQNKRVSLKEARASEERSQIGRREMTITNKKSLGRKAFDYTVASALAIYVIAFAAKFSGIIV